VSLVYRDALYGPVYDAMSVPVVLLLTDGVTQFPDLRCLDKTAGTTLGGPVELQTVVPAAMFIAGELLDAGIDRDTDLDGASVTFNAHTWRIADHKEMPSPGGADDGEVMLILEEP
jgi:hypothetical protein